MGFFPAMWFAKDPTYVVEICNFSIFLLFFLLTKAFRSNQAPLVKENMKTVLSSKKNVNEVKFSNDYNSHPLT